MSRLEHEFYTKYNPSMCMFEINSGKRIVDASGYVPPKERIKSILRAGELLESVRREKYDYGPNDVDDGTWMDPLRTPGLDYADISALQSRALANMRAKAEAEAMDDPEVESETKNTKGNRPETSEDKEPQDKAPAS